MRRPDPIIPGVLLAGVMAFGCIGFTYPHPEPEIVPTPVYIPHPSVAYTVPQMPSIALEEVFTPVIDGNIPAADPADITRLTQMAWGEGRGVESKAQQAALYWCVFNRVDDPRWPDTIAEVCTEGQFHGYSPSNPIDPELYELALDVYERWQREKLGDPNPGRTLPAEYVFFGAKGGVNYFRTEYDSFDNIWDWSLPDPYGGGLDETMA